jgi:deoxyhypusine synthase
MAKPKKTVTGRVLHDPVKDKLRPIYPLDLSKTRTIDQLVRAMGDTAYTARQIGDGADVLEVMARDKDCFVVMTLAGALTVGKMGLVFCDLIESHRFHRRAHGAWTRRGHRSLTLPLRPLENGR